jgi:cytochrome P450
LDDTALAASALSDGEQTGILTLEGVDDIDEVLRSTAFRQGAHQESLEFFGGTVLMLDGDPHFERRRIESSLFSRGSLIRMEHGVLGPSIDRTLAETQRRHGSAPFNLVEFTRTVLLRIAAALSGIDSPADDDSVERLAAYIHDMIDAAEADWRHGDSAALAIENGIRAREGFVEEFFRPSVERRRAMLRAPVDVRRTAGSGGGASDLLLELMGGGGMTEDAMLREVALYIDGAIKTTSQSVPHAFGHVEEWCASHPEDAKTDPEFLRKALAESLRLHGTVPSLLRICTQDILLASGVEIRSGRRVSLDFRNANLDPGIFGADAASFNPHRVPRPPHKPWGLTFGTGPHTCIGRLVVTGIPGVTEGSGTMMLRRLFEAGARTVPGQPPVRETQTGHDRYTSFAVELG